MSGTSSTHTATIAAVSNFLITFLPLLPLFSSMDDYELHQFLEINFGIVGYKIVMAKFITLLNF